MKKQIEPNIKAHLLRGAFYLLLLLAVCAIPFALAQRNGSKRSVANPVAQPSFTGNAYPLQNAPPSTGAVSVPDILDSISANASAASGGSASAAADSVQAFNRSPFRNSLALRAQSSIETRGADALKSLLKP